MKAKSSVTEFCQMIRCLDLTDQKLVGRLYGLLVLSELHALGGHLGQLSDSTLHDVRLIYELGLEENFDTKKMRLLCTRVVDSIDTSFGFADGSPLQRFREFEETIKKAKEGK